MQNGHKCLLAWSPKSFPCGRGNLARRRKASLAEITIRKRSVILQKSSNVAMIVSRLSLASEVVGTVTSFMYLSVSQLNSWLRWPRDDSSVWFPRDRHGLLLWFSTIKIPRSFASEDVSFGFVATIIAKFSHFLFDERVCLLIIHALLM